jgi:mannose-6-phosphate isomerase-like protein (cupin superfamily)/predicted GNAT family acetyltransferase
MSGIGKYLAEELLKEIEEIKDYVVVYSGRFQPFHKGHYATYQHLVKKFGKSNVYIGTSDKTDKLKSPFNFNEKRELMVKMFGIPSNRIIQIKNPYAPTEILKNFDETTTAFITVVGEKDQARLGGKYFTPYKGNLEAGYKERGYVYTSPAQPNAISGTDVRNWLGSGEVEDRKTLFTKAYPKFDNKIFNLITKKLDTLNERIFIPIKVIEYWIHNRLGNFLKETSLSNSGGTKIGKDTDDGPNFFFPNYDAFDTVAKSRAEQIGYTLFRQIMSKELEDYYEHPIYPKGPVKAVTPFPAGVIGATTATNQKDYFGDEAYEKWYSHVTRSMGLAGYDVVKGLEDISKELSIQSADNIKKAAGIKKIKDTNQDDIIKEESMGIPMGYPSKEQLAQKKKERDVLRKKMDSGSAYYKKVDEDITIPINIGDTVLGGKFKNKKIVVKDIGKNEKGEITVNGKPLLKYRLIDEAYKEAIAELMKDPQFEELLSEIPLSDLEKIDKFADTQLDPLNIVLTGRHFMDRLVDPRNKKPISGAELTGFFKRLSRKKNEFVEFLKKYGEVVAKDNRTKLNIPFMKQANKAIAKTIMRKDDFKTPSPELKFELKIHNRIIEGIGADFGNAPYVVDLDDLTKSNTNYRTTKWTGKKLQMTLMSIDDEIGLEVHNDGDQFLRVEEGEGKVLMGKTKDNLDIEEMIEDDYAIFIPAGYYHNIINTGDTPLKLYAIYAPVEHPKGRIDKVKPVNEDTVKHISKSLGVSRKDMPQINSNDVGEFVKYLKDKGVSVSSSVINVSKVGMTQKDINVDKVRDLLGVDRANLAKPVIISKDNYILDGHHRVAALYNIDKDFRLKTIKVDLGIRDLLKTAKGFPKVSYKNINESSDISPLGGGNNSARWTPVGKAKKLGIEQLAGYTQTDFPIADSMDISGEKDSWISQSKTAKYNNKVKAKRDANGNLVLESIESDLEKEYGVEADIYEFGDYIELSKVVVPKENRGSGIGSKFMNDLIKYAKANNKDIFLTPSSDFGGSKGRLIQFYKGFGFKPNKGRDRDFRSKNTMVLHTEGTSHMILDENGIDTRTLLLCGGSYGHMAHPFDIEINLTFGQLKDIVKRALNGELELTREKCVAGDTVIHTEKNGDMTIAEFVDNNLVDKVLSFNEETGQNEYMDVMASFNNDTTDEWLEIELEDSKTIQVTPNHRMYVEGIGYVEAKDLTEDIELYTSTGSIVKIKSIKRINKEQNRYDLKVDGFSCYYANDILVHNTDGQALAVSWVNGRLVAARNKSHLKDRGKGAMDINAVASKFAGRGGLTDAYNFAMKDLSAAIDKLSQKQKEKVFGNGSKFMNLEVIYPESVNVIPYGQALLVFHGTFEYDEAGNIIGEDQSAGRVLAGMIKQINQNVQSKYTIQGPPVTKLPKNKELSKLQPKYFGMISKLQSEFGLKDNQGVGEYHQKWWENFVNKNAPALDAQQKIGLVKRWAFGDKGFRLKEIGDEKIRKWADKIDKEDQSKISKENIMKFEKIFLGVGADVLSFMSSVLTVNPDKAKRVMADRLEKTIKDIEAKGSEAQIAKLRLELQRIADLGGFEKLVPNEGIVFQYPSGPNGYTMKLTGFFSAHNQINGIFFSK